MAVKLRDVARRAGVSAPTASRVLSGSDYPVAAELRERVERAAHELDYVPNAQARALLRGNQGSVGVLVGEVDDPYFSEIVNGIQEVAAARHLLVTICHTRRDVDRELEYFRLLQAHRTGIVIIAGSGLTDGRYISAMAARSRSFESAGGRVVAIGDPLFDVDRVLADNRSGAHQLGAHLAGLGHREIGVVAGDPAVASTLERVAGLRETVGAVGGTLVVRHGPATRDGGHDGAAELLARHPGLTAIVGTADQMAIGALAHLREARRAVPEGLSVAGFNDIAVARDLVPALTTVRLPLRAMGAAALEMALAAAPTAEPLVSELGTELVVRGSTGPAPRR